MKLYMHLNTNTLWTSMNQNFITFQQFKSTSTNNLLSIILSNNDDL